MQDDDFSHIGPDVGISFEKKSFEFGQIGCEVVVVLLQDLEFDLDFSYFVEVVVYINQLVENDLEISIFVEFDVL